MTETPTTEAPSLRFAHVGRAVGAEAPLPPQLERRVPQKLRRRHAQLVERIAEAGRQTAALRGQIDAAPRADRAKAARAALEGSEAPEPTLPALRDELERTVEARRALEDALAASADAQLREIAPAAGEAAAELEREFAEQVDQVRGGVAALREQVFALADLQAGLLWAHGLARTVAGGQGTVHPWRRGRGESFRLTSGELNELASALEQEAAAAADRPRQAEREAAQRAQAQAGWEREVADREAAKEKRRRQAEVAREEE
jgi:hypothetical protein